MAEVQTKPTLFWRLKQEGKHFKQVYFVHEVEMVKAYDEIVDFIASGTSPESVAGFQPSEDVKERVRELIAREKEDTLSTEETTELNLYVQLEHIMRLAKARARRLMVA